MSNPIQDGRFYGQVAVSRRLGDLVLSETTYEAGAVVPWHAHESPLVCLVLRGALEEFTARGHRRFPGGALFYHPRHEPHAHRFEPPGVRCFTLILGAGLLRRLEGYAPLALPGPTERTASPAAWLARQLHAEFRRGAGGSDLVLEGLALAILGELTRGPARGRQAVGRSRSRRFAPWRTTGPSASWSSRPRSGSTRCTSPDVPPGFRLQRRGARSSSPDRAGTPSAARDRSPAREHWPGCRVLRPGPLLPAVQSGHRAHSRRVSSSGASDSGLILEIRGGRPGDRGPVISLDHPECEVDSRSQASAVATCSCST